MPGASVKVGPVRVGSGCCVALVVPVLIIVAIGALVLSGSIFASSNIPRVLGGFPQPITIDSSYKPHIKQSPVPAYVDDPNIYISWNVERTLEKKNHWAGELEIPNHERGIRCAGRAYASSYEHTKRGKIAILDFVLPLNTNEWCAGRMVINLCVNWCGEPFLEIEGRIFDRP